ncbi:MAG: metal-dependent hydrolase [Chitinophagaceae bacterium]|nr:metal-dependent hydrolase [Chitinophagaceae bacterium]
MDSITHIVMGAAIGDTLLGKKAGRKAALAGAFLKTFPDFDLFISGLSDNRKYILYHRSHTHAFLVEFLCAFPLALIFYFLFRKRISYKEWFMLSLVCLWGHSIVDVFTNYGTRLFLPFTNQLYSLNNISIVDLIFTVPMLLFVLVGLFFKNQSRGRMVCMRSSLLYAVLYLCLTFFNKIQADKVFRTSLKAKQTPYTSYMSNPTILNNLLWYSLATTRDSLYVGLYSLLEDSRTPEWRVYARHTELLDKHPSTKDIQLLTWFSQGYYICNRREDTLDFYAVKFGPTSFRQSDTSAEKFFLFYYKLYTRDGKEILDFRQPSQSKEDFGRAFDELLDRIAGKKIK